MGDIVGETLGGRVSGQTDLILVNNNQTYLANLDGSPYKPGNRHFGTKFHHIREEIWLESVSMRCEPVNLMSANSLTNILDDIKQLHYCQTIGMED